jgi:putative NADPH-quinone reductase
MNILIVLAHPDKNSFNHAIAKTCKNRLIENGHSVTFYDLWYLIHQTQVQYAKIPFLKTLWKPFGKSAFSISVE